MASSNEKQWISIKKTGMTKQKRLISILLLGLLTAIVPFSIDMYLPGFPDIAKSMGTTVTKISLSLSSFFIGTGLGQLMYGPLLDRFGRKKPLYAGLLLYCIASLGCAFSTEIDTFILLRFIQALGACSATIAATAMVRDLFPPEENAKIFSFLILVLSASPMLAPTMGSYLSTSLGWSSIFIVLAILIITIFLGVFFFLPESKGADKGYSLRVSSILKSYGAVLRESYFTIYAFLGAIAFASLFTYIASSPGVFMEHFGLTQKQYGWLFAGMASGLILASQINTLLLKYYRSERIILGALILQNCFGASLLLVSLLDLAGFWGYGWATLFILVHHRVDYAECFRPCHETL
nr:MgtE intracellular N domain protein [uncultured bacterium]